MILTKLKRLIKQISLVKITTIMVFFAVIYELQASVVFEILFSFGQIPSGTFIQNRLYFEAFLIGLFGLTTIISDRALLKNKLFQLYIFMACLMVVTIYFHKDLYGFPNDQTDQSISAFEFWIPILFKYAVFVIIGYYLNKTAPFRHLYLLSCIVVAVTVLLHVDFDSLSLDRRAYIATANNGNYLFLGDATALSVLMLLAFYKNVVLRLLLMVAFSSLLFLIGSRTSFVFFAVTTLLFLLWTTNAKAIPYFILFLVGLGVTYTSIDLEELSKRNERMTNLFLAYDEDNSVIGRANLSEFGWEDIKANPILGNFGGQLDYAKSRWRTYIHSGFSYWRQFGITLFGCILFFVYKLARWLIDNASSKNTDFYGLVFLVCIFIFIEGATSRSFAFTQSHMFFGLLIATQELIAPKTKMKPDRDKSAAPSRRRRKRRRRRRTSKSVNK